jgi:hypothetical protein
MLQWEQLVNAFTNVVVQEVDKTTQTFCGLGMKLFLTFSNYKKL